MAAARPFLDSNVLLYLFSADAAKADRAETLLEAGGHVNVQVLNEITNVARRKMAMPWPEVDDALAVIRSLCTAEPLTLDVHDRGRAVAQRHGLSVWDSMIVAAALVAGCDILYSEDMHDGLRIDGQLRIVNPFDH
jgi:predicted nucleic acid-binding protein